MPLEHAIMAFIEFEPMTGYDLKKYFDVSVAHFWSATQSHIYKSLNRLEKKGWAESKVIPQEDRPNRKEFHITDIGQAELRRWLVTPLPLEQVREGWLIQVFFSHLSSNEEIATLLKARMDEMRTVIKTLREDVQTSIDKNAQQVGMERSRELWQITLDYGINYYEAELAWLVKTMERVRGLPPLMLPQ